MRLLGDILPEWDQFLDGLTSPVGVAFWAQLGGGEEEYVVQQDSQGFWAVPIDGGASRQLNPTQAEFHRLNLDRLFERLSSAGSLGGAPQSLPGTAGAYALGHRAIEGHTVAVFVVPQASDLSEQRAARTFLAPDQSVSVGVALVPEPAEIPPDARRILRQQRIVIGQLPVRSPWEVDWSPLATTGDLGLDFQDLGALCRHRFVLIVDKKQQKVWVEGQLLDLRAGKQPYSLLEHLADRPGVSVPNDALANLVLASEATESMEGKIVDGAKSEIKKALRKALASVSEARVTADSLISTDGGRQRLTVPANLVLIRS